MLDVGGWRIEGFVILGLVGFDLFYCRFADF